MDTLEDKVNFNSFHPTGDSTSAPTPSWEDIIEDIKYLCQYTCEGEYANYQEWKEYNNGDDGYGHIYELAKRIQEYFDPPDDDIPF